MTTKQFVCVCLFVHLCIRSSSFLLHFVLRNDNVFLAWILVFSSLCHSLIQSGLHAESLGVVSISLLEWDVFLLLSSPSLVCRGLFIMIMTGNNNQSVLRDFAA